jgi:Pseudouridylate synthases, 23S RNA-specific
MTKTPPSSDIFFTAQKPGRLDKLLVERFPETHRKFWKEHLTQLVRVNGKRAVPGGMAQPGDRIEVKFPRSLQTAVLANPKLIPKILFKDAWLIAVDKPAGLPCHPLRTGETGTVANAMVAKFPELLGLGAAAFESGLLHRLDNETSGVLLFARSPEAWRKFSALNRGGKIDKYYLAWVADEIRERGKILVPIAHHPKRKRRMLAVDNEADARRLKARPARSEFERVKSHGIHSLVRVKIHKGNRHQIRVHMAWQGHPILGDKVYGGKVADAAPRQLLHAERVEFTHPFTGKKTIISAPLPEDMRPPAK